MKKFAKMSLVAAIAVAGLTSTATAGSLEEAIKGVNISGFVEYRAEKAVQSGSDVASEMKHDIDIRLQAVVPVNDMVTATIRFDESQDEDNDSLVGGTTNATSINASSLDLQVDRAFFTYMNNGLSVSGGLMGAVLTDGGQADGFSVSKTFNGVSLSAGYQYTSSPSVIAADDVTWVAASGTAANIAYNVTYATVVDSASADTLGTDLDGSANALHAGVSTTVEGISLSANYGSRTDMATMADQTQWKIGASTTVSGVTLGAEYAKNNQDGGETMLDGSDVAGSEISIGALELSKEGDASAFLLSAAVAVGEKGTAKLRYASSTSDVANSDRTVIRANYDYQMSSNFKAYLEYTVNDLDSDTEKASDYVVGAKYTF